MLELYTILIIMGCYFLEFDRSTQFGSLNGHSQAVHPKSEAMLCSLKELCKKANGAYPKEDGFPQHSA